MRRTLLCVVGVLLCSAPALAQTVPANAPLRIVATHDGLLTDDYYVQIDGGIPQVATPKSTALVGNLVTLNHPGVPRGSHQIVLCARNADASACTQPVAFVAQLPPPNAPTQLQISAVLTVSIDPLTGKAELVAAAFNGRVLDLGTLK